MQTTNTISSKQNVSKYLIYATFVLLIVNFLLIFLPFVEVYQPSQKVTTLGAITYEGWYTDRASMATFIVPIFFTGIPYICSIISFASSSRKEKTKNNLAKLKENSFTKPIRFFWLKAASIINLVMMIYVLFNALDQTASLTEYGAYAKITLFGIFNFFSTIALIIILIVLSKKTKAIFGYIKLASEVPSNSPQMAE